MTSVAIDNSNDGTCTGHNNNNNNNNNTVYVERCCDDAYDRILAMIRQDETTYATKDYINRRRKRSTSIVGEYPSSTGTINHIVVNDDSTVDPSFRGKMCQWSYRICDHFGTNREIVSFAFSFLDRFIDAYNCDRSGFKLAAMTSMYVATKMMNVKVLRVGCLVEMCQGEFHADQFLQMERVILSALQFRLNPPIPQAFIVQLCIFLPTMDDMIASDVFSRSIFYAELSTYDYRFVPQSNCLIAIGCVLNALFDCYNDSEIAEIVQATFLASLCRKLGNSVIDFGVMQDIQERLWFLHNCSAESSYDTVQYFDMDLHQTKRYLKYPMILNNVRDHVSVSPVSVTVATNRNSKRVCNV